MINGWSSDRGNTTTIFGRFGYGTQKTLRDVVCIELCENLNRDIVVHKKSDDFQMISMRADSTLQAEIRNMEDYDPHWERPELVFSGNRLNVDHAFANMRCVD